MSCGGISYELTWRDYFLLGLLRNKLDTNTNIAVMLFYVGLVVLDLWCWACGCKDILGDYLIKAREVRG